MKNELIRLPRNELIKKILNQKTLSIKYLVLKAFSHSKISAYFPEHIYILPILYSII